MMASHIDESQDQVLAACIAIVYVLDTASNNWKALGEQGGFSNVQLLQTRQNALYRIRGRLLNNGQIVINVLLEKDIKYEVLDQDKSSHIISSHSDVFLLKLRQESDGDQFATVVRNILRLLQETSSPREAWMPASAATQPAAQAQPIKEHLLNSSNLGNKNPFQPQTLFQSQRSLPPQSGLQSQNKSSVLDRTKSRDQGFTASTVSLATVSLATASLATTSLATTSLATRPWHNAQRGNWKLVSSEVDQYCDKLSNAIQEGSVEVATEVAKIMAEQNVSLSIKQKNPKIITVNPGEDSFNLRVVVEDRETSGGVFQMKVSTNTTVAELQEEVAERYGFPPKVQKWISGMKMAKPHEKLFDLNLRGKGATAYLYIVDGRSVGLRRPEFDKYIKKQEERKNAQLSMSLELNAADPQMPLTAISGTQLPRTASLPSLPREGQSIGSSASGNLPAAVPLTRETQVMNPAQFSGITAPQEINTRQTVGTPGSEAKIFSSSSISDLQHMIASLRDESLPNVLWLHSDQRPNNTVVETEVIPQGWVCEKCTFVNKPTRPGCEICGEGRPEDYVVPANPQISEQERLRIEKERQETEIFQRTGLQ